MKKQHRNKRRANTATGIRLNELPQTGRALAWHALCRFDERGQFVSETIRQCAPESQQYAQALDVAATVLRRRRTIHTILQSQTSRPRSGIEPDLWRLLELGAGQILFCETPAHAAVSTTVELARQAGRGRWTGFVNGILRNVARLRTEEFTEAPAADCVPVSEGRYRRLAQCVLPDPNTHLESWLGHAFSLPRALVRRWSGRFTPEQVIGIGFYSLTPPPVCLRVNRLKTTVDDVRRSLLEGGVNTRVTEHPWVLQASGSGDITRWPGFTDGDWIVQDTAAALAAEVPELANARTILDLCAAPGGKTTQLAEISQGRARIVACDISEGRSRLLTDNFRRMGLHNIETALISAEDLSGIPSGPYDAVLVDAPCSNSGVLARRPEARWRFSESGLSELVHLQTRLLLTACSLVRPGGNVVYTTCSIEKEETEDVAAAVPKALRSVRKLRSRLLLPGSPADGAYQAVFQTASS